MNTWNIPADTYEEMVREDERERIHRIYENRKQRKALRKIERRHEMIVGALQRILGIAIIVFTFVLCRSGFCYDVTTGINDTGFALFTIPVGLFLMFAPNLYRKYV